MSFSKVFKHPLYMQVSCRLGIRAINTDLVLALILLLNFLAWNLALECVEQPERMKELYMLCWQVRH